MDSGDELLGYQKIACLGGLYSNHLALAAALDQLRDDAVDQIFCLGDFGAFGPHPDRVFPLVQEANVLAIRGNYDDSIGYMRTDCQCGYTDPRDNYFAQISYDYTLAKTSSRNRLYLRDLPLTRRLRLGALRVLLCHGSPRQFNEFLWESTSSDAFLRRLLHETQSDVLLCTHTGIKWMRQLGPGQYVVNVGVLGRPENDGTPRVWYTVLQAEGRELTVDFRPVEYDVERLADEMRQERLPEEFVETIQHGWWTTCLEILPARERRRGPY